MACGAPQVTALLALLPVASTVCAEIRVFTDRAHPVTGPAGVAVTELDAPARQVAALGTGLPSDPARAESIMRQRLADASHGSDARTRIARAYQGVADAYNAGIAKLPAVMLDGRYVVYGEPDVSQALARIAAYRSTQP
ncbi:TIGR03757 family integrating conjugative element protein [Xanthomonas citri pv. malvacearum]|uniref:TIGR03757 family integrating conjugative element protein n=2 Tax=Xanthomonas TaxID=338 RepID=A0AA45BX85_XANCM|nr:TIGR03757 family integrating conjugative element protein [Xanthomonas citri]ASY84461.1 TIGR03757 family integrating conjugative element protein [Xanthomonas citri pv. malvacearum]NMI13661.1 TIGR03757 family integrating conjugative element protein [Xanthomonas citri]PUE95510.1 TIGR03757 family integrating conjugative element protein [Xanthomonas citri pv. malvacearum]QGL19451.1 TIGR03757 family integrating conjugative element protein [Xanthomonas citri pv. malvacearum]